MGGGSFFDAVRRRQAAGFVARTDELARFRTNLGLSADDADRRFIFSVYGDGGVGKTFLTQRLRGVADERGAATSWVDDRVFGVPEAMRAISADLSRAGEDMTAFDKLLRNYLERRSEVEADPDAPAGAASFITKTAVRVGLHAAHAVPGVGGVAASVDADAAAEQADRLRSFLGKKFRSHEDVRLLLSPAEVLSPAFVDALARAARRRTLVMFFDTYEQTGVFLDGWLRSLLHCDYGDVPENMIVTVAGRHQLDQNDWGEYASVLANVPLAPFTEAEARQLLAAKGVTDERVVGVILNVSGRLPLLVAMLAENQPTDPGTVGDPSGDAVERFLKWETDPERRLLAVGAALPRVVSEDVLGVLTSARGLADTARGQLFDWLRSLPFVTRDAGRCTYHEVVRTAMLRLERSQSPMRWRERHQALAEAYRQWRVTAFAEDAWDNAEWLSFRLEEAYHLLCADPAGQLPAALTGLVYAIENGLTTAAKWAQMVLQAGSDRDAAAVLTWGQRLEETLRGGEDEARVGCLTMLLRERKIAEQAMPVALRVRGRALCVLSRTDDGLADLDKALEIDPMDKQALAYRGNCYRWIERNDEALADLNRAIEIDPAYEYAIGRRGMTYFQLGRYDEAISDFNRAIELAPRPDWHLAGRGAVYQEKYEYDQAISDLNRAVELNPDAWTAERGETYRLAGQYERAIADFDRAIELDADDAWAIGSRGQAYFAKGEYERAISDLTRGIEIDPDLGWIIAARGRAYRCTDRYDMAIADFDRAIELEPTYAWAFAERGYAYQLKGQHDQAISDLTRAIELDTEYLWAIAQRGEAYRLTDQYEQAIADFTRAIELDTDHAWAIASRGQAYRQTGQYDQAISDLSRAIELNPELDWAIADRGEAYGLTGEHDQAARDLARAMELKASWAWTIAGRAEEYRQLGQHEQAIAVLTRAIELNPGSARALACRADAYRLAGQYERAIGDFNRAIELDPGSPGAFSHRGEAYRLAGQYERAIADLTRAIELDTGSAWAIARRSQAYRQTGQYDQAISDLSRVIELDTDDAWAIASRGHAYRQTGQYDLAISDLTHAIELDPDYVWAIAQRGEAYRLTDQYDQAIADFTRAIELDADDAWAIASRGQAYRQTGQYDQAISDLSRAIELDPSLNWAIFDRGEAYRLSGQYDLAIADFTRAIEINPEDAWPIVGRAQAYRTAHRYEEALADIDRVIGHENNRDWALYQRFLVLDGCGDHERAAVDLAAAIRIVSARLATNDAGDNDPYNLAIYRAASGDVDRACGDLALAIERFPELGLVYEAVEDLRELNGVPGMDATVTAPLLEALDAAKARIEAAGSG